MAQAEIVNPRGGDVDPAETAEWLESLAVRARDARGPSACSYLLTRARRDGLSATASNCRSRPPRPTSTRSRPISQPRLPRQSRDRTPHQEHHPLERDGDGRARQPRPSTASAATSRPTPRPPRCTKWPSTTSSAAAATITPATRSISKATPRPACTPARFSKAGSTEAATGQLPPRAAAAAAACRPIRIRG